jgi:hypothetical protein
MWLNEPVAVVAHRVATALLTGVALAGPVLAVTPLWAKAPADACLNTRYSMRQLPFLPTAISPAGLVAGTNEVSRPVVWQARTGTRELPVPEGFHSAEPVAVTTSGKVIVDAFDAQHRMRAAFVYSGRSILEVAGEQTFVHGASPSGLVLGESVPAGEARAQAVYWSNNVPHTLGLCCGGTLKAANRSGEMVGEAYDEQGRYQAFEWHLSRHEPRLIGTEHYSAAVAINDAGDILVQAGRAVYLEQAGRLRQLDLSAALVNTARSMNNCGFVVGGYGPDSDRNRGFLWTPRGGFQDLNPLIPPGSAWTIQDAFAINDRGQIVGRAVHNRDEAGFILTPLMGK